MGLPILDPSILHALIPSTSHFLILVYFFHLCKIKGSNQTGQHLHKWRPLWIRSRAPPIHIADLATACNLIRYRSVLSRFGLFLDQLWCNSLFLVLLNYGRFLFPCLKIHDMKLLHAQTPLSIKKTKIMHKKTPTCFWNCCCFAFFSWILFCLSS